ncbi:hypothetical protein [Burkholderia anthina]|uniref:hypothetical protein n=1 Tax=Burkholderia anthina TaxID=179879 RepID=UPI00158B0FDB|nr:hypothetical protein [Burkholderia anthina]
MIRRKKGVSHEDPAIEIQPKRAWWKDMSSKAVVAVVASTGGVLAATYNDALTSFIKPGLANAWAWTQDRISPMADDKLIGVSLTFFIPPNVDKGRSAESVSVTLSPEHCKRPDGVSIKKAYGDRERDSYTNAIVGISCRASGRTVVTLTPESGAAVTVYDGIPKDGEQVAFSGVTGSYYAGIASLYWLDKKMPDGPWVPVNKCQLTNTCADELRKDMERSRGSHDVM